MRLCTWTVLRCLIIQVLNIKSLLPKCLIQIPFTSVTSNLRAWVGNTNRELIDPLRSVWYTTSLVIRSHELVVIWFLAWLKLATATKADVTVTSQMCVMEDLGIVVTDLVYQWNWNYTDASTRYHSSVDHLYCPMAFTTRFLDLQHIWLILVPHKTSGLQQMSEGRQKDKTE